MALSTRSRVILFAALAVLIALVLLLWPEGGERGADPESPRGGRVETPAPAAELLGDDPIEGASDPRSERALVVPDEPPAEESEAPSAAATVAILVTRLDTGARTQPDDFFTAFSQAFGDGQRRKDMTSGATSHHQDGRLRNGLLQRIFHLAPLACRSLAPPATADVHSR